MGALSTDTVVAVIGAGTMGAGIAQVAAAAGHPVLLMDAQKGAAEKGKAGIEKALARLVEKGRMEAGDRDALLGRIEVVGGVSDLAKAGLVIEAIIEDLDIKVGLFKELEGVLGEDAILASNTSSLSITALAAPLENSGRLVGMHFFNPPPLMALVEVITGLATDSGMAKTVFDTAEAWGKAPVYAKSTPGFIVNRIARPFYGEGLRLLQEGAGDPATIDAILRDCGGFRMGPFELMDLVGLDVNLAVTTSVWKLYYNDPRYIPNLMQEEMVAAGRFGRKSGRGWYDYADSAEQPKPKSEPTRPEPEEVRLIGDLGPAAPVADLIRKAGIKVEERDDEEAENLGGIYIGAGGAVGEGGVIKITDGTSATERAAVEEEDNLVHLDLCLDYGACSRVVLAPGDNTEPQVLALAVGLFQKLGKDVTVIPDVPGMVLMRILAMLANEAAEAAYHGVATPAGIDTAMMKGVNYPKGPLAWADEISLPWILMVLEGLTSQYGEDRYRASALLRRKVFGGGRFHDGS